MLPDRFHAHRASTLVENELDLVTGDDPEALTELLGDHDLSFRTDPMSHTRKYNHCRPFQGEAGPRKVSENPRRQEVRTSCPFFVEILDPGPSDTQGQLMGGVLTFDEKSGEIDHIASELRPSTNARVRLRSQRPLGPVAMGRLFATQVATSERSRACADRRPPLSIYPAPGFVGALRGDKRQRKPGRSGYGCTHRHGLLQCETRISRLLGTFAQPCTIS